MWTVSQQFLDTIGQHHSLVTTCTVTPYGGSPIVLPVVSGTVTIDRSQRIRRTASLVIEGGTSLYSTLSSPGTRIAIDHGFAWSGTERELVPQIRSELTSAALPLGSGTLQVALGDYWQRLAASDYLTPYTPSTAASRVAEIINAVVSAIPGTTIRNSASDTGTIATAQAWTSRSDMISAFATDGGMEAFFAPDGAFVLRDAPTIAAAAVYLIRTGPSGTLDSLTRSRPLDKLYNTVVLTPATADPSQTWTQVVAQITDTADPRHPNRIGVRPYRYSAPTLLTVDTAATVAKQILSRITGTTETLSLSALSNPALEPGDIVRAVTPLDGGADIVNHFLEQVTIDLATGAMTANTRSNTEFAA